MNSRERALLALNHREPDRVPFDLGGTVVTGINYKPYQALRRLGLPDRPPVLVSSVQQLAQVDDDVLDRLGVDVENVSLRSSETFQIEVKDGGDYTYFYDEFKIGWRMPKDGGLYYDMFEHPLPGKITAADVDAFPWLNPLDPARFVGLKEAAEHVRNVEKRAVIVDSMGSGIIELFAWTRGFKDYFMDLALLACTMVDSLEPEGLRH